MIDYAFWLISQNRTDYVKKYLFNPQSINSTINIATSNCNNDNYSNDGVREKVECGYDGITQDQCMAIGGCYWNGINANASMNNYKFEPSCYNCASNYIMYNGSNAIVNDLNYIVQIWQNPYYCGVLGVWFEFFEF